MVPLSGNAIPYPVWPPLLAMPVLGLAIVKLEILPVLA